MIRPLPLDEGDRIVRLIRMEDGRRQAVDVVDLAALRARCGRCSDSGATPSAKSWSAVKETDASLGATVADPVLFTVARTPALFGRILLPSDAARGRSR